MRFSPRLRTIFFTVNLLILLLPLGGVVLMRLYESVLIRRTESELVVQGAHVSASFIETLRDELREQGRPPSSYGAQVSWNEERRSNWLSSNSLSSRRAPEPRGIPFGQRALHPIEPRLDLAADPIYPPPQPARAVEAPADEAARRAGRRMSKAMRAAQRITLAGIRVVDHRGVVVASTRTELGLSLAHREEVRRALEGYQVALMRQRISDEPPPPLDSISRGTGLRVFVALPAVVDDRVWGAVVLSRTPQAVSQSLYTLRFHILGGALALLTMIALISLITSRTITQPMEELIRQSERVASGERGAAMPLARSGTLEVRRVSEAIARMAQALEERADYIDTFARGVSHEFKTPLASMRGTVELLRDHLEEMTPEERDTFLDNLEQDTERLTRLVSRLADLARADVIKPTQESTSAPEVIDELTGRFGASGLEVAVTHGDGVSTVMMARETLDSILTNLLDNARQHGGAEVEVQLSTARLTLAEGRAMVQFEVEDNGPGISPANQAKVFDRFFTTARHRGGSGLGLNIVRKLVVVHGGEVELESEPGRTVFRFTLPADQ